MTLIPPQKSPAGLKSTASFQEEMHYLLTQAQKKGATDAEVSLDQSRGFSVDVRMKEVETVAFSDSQTMSVILYNGHQKGCASTSDLSARALDNLIDAAWHIAQVSAVDPCFGLAEAHLLCKQPPDLGLCHLWSLSPEDAIRLAIACETEALSQDAAIVNSEGVNVSTYTDCNGYANTRGANGVVMSTRHQMSCSLIAQGRDKKLQRDYDYTVGRRSDALMSTSQLAQKAAERTVKRLGARKLKTQQAPVLFEARIATHLISSFIGAISGRNLYQKQSFLVDSLGKQLFPEWFHLQEHPYIVGALGSSAFDAEGVLTRENVFVDQGRIQQYVLSSYSARRLGLETSANAGGVHNLTVQSNAPDLIHLMKTMQKGLLVTELMGQGIDLQTGDYSRGASGFWVENGEIQFPVEEVTIAGRLQDMYPHIIGVGADCDPNHATRCGSILIEQMTIAGH